MKLINGFQKAKGPSVGTKVEGGIGEGKGVTAQPLGSFNKRQKRILLKFNSELCRKK